MKAIKLFTVAIYLLSANLSQAQVHIRPEIGLNLAQMHIESNDAWASREFSTQMKPGIKLGVSITAHVSRGLFIEPGLFYSMKGFKKKDVLFSSWTLPVIFTKATISYATNYIEVPVNLGYNLDLKKGGSIVVTAGPYMAFLLGGKEKAKFESRYEDISRSLDIGKDDEDDIKPFDFGLNIGLGYQSTQGIYFRVQYGIGVANLIPLETAGNWKNRVLSFSIGYDFPTRSNKKQ